MDGNLDSQARHGIYQLCLPMFEGPLDILLSLIEREQLSINEVSLISVLDQFMAFIDQLGNLSPEAIAEFVAVAGRLSVLKSRSLLPRPATIPEEVDELDLVRQLEEYRAYKAGAHLLAMRQQTRGVGFEKGGGIAFPLPLSPRPALQTPSALSKALERWLTRGKPLPTPVTLPKGSSLKEMMLRIVLLVETTPSVKFDAIRRDCLSRQDIAIAFLGVLTLLRRQTIDVTQQKLFGPITIARASTSFDVHLP